MDPLLDLTNIKEKDEFVELIEDIKDEYAEAYEGTKLASLIPLDILQSYYLFHSIQRFSNLQTVSYVKPRWNSNTFSEGDDNRYSFIEYSRFCL